MDRFSVASHLLGLSFISPFIAIFTLLVAIIDDIINVINATSVLGLIGSSILTLSVILGLLEANLVPYFENYVYHMKVHGDHDARIYLLISMELMILPIFAIDISLPSNNMYIVGLLLLYLMRDVIFLYILFRI